MTLTAPNCPMAGPLVREVNQKVEAVDDVNTVKVKLVWDSPWNRDMKTEEAKLELGLL